MKFTRGNVQPQGNAPVRREAGIDWVVCPAQAGRLEASGYHTLSRCRQGPCFPPPPPSQPPLSISSRCSKRGPPSPVRAQGLDTRMSLECSGHLSRRLGEGTALPAKWRFNCSLTLRWTHARVSPKTRPPSSPGSERAR